MTTASAALTALGIKEWVMRGEPTDSASFGSNFSKVIGVRDNGSGIETSDQSKWGVTWTQVSAKIKELQDAEPKRLLRIERNQKLAETDFYALSDVTLSNDMKIYRQNLRDLPGTATPKLKADGSLVLLGQLNHKGLKCPYSDHEYCIQLRWLEKMLLPHATLIALFKEVVVIKMLSLMVQ